MTVSPRAVADLIRTAAAGVEAPRVVTSGNAALPGALLRLADGLLPSYRLFMLNAPCGIPVRTGVIHETPFVGAGMRHRSSLHYIPARLSQVPGLFRSTCPPDLVLLHTSAPHGGKVSMGTEVNVLPAAVEAARDRGASVLAQIDRSMPYTLGDGELELDQIDGAIEIDEPPPAPTPARTPGMDVSEELARIGRLVASRVVDGATLQMGIGLVPDAVLPRLLDRRRLRIWSEMVSDGVLALEQAGALDPDQVVTASFAVGGPRLHAWLDRNEHVRMLRTETTNAPEQIARNPAMTSINTALQVDLFGQANASRIGGRVHSGFGGQPDFLVGALHAPHGQALLALRSWHPRADVSTIVPLVDEPVTSFQATAVVTEQGVAEVWGYDERTQAAHLIEHAAHPRVRAELWEEAEALGLA